MKEDGPNSLKIGKYLQRKIQKSARPGLQLKSLIVKITVPIYLVQILLYLLMY